MKNKKSYLTFLILDIFFITIAFLFMIYLKPASVRVYLPAYIKPFLGFSVAWLVASFVGDKYNIDKFNKLINLFYSILRVDSIVTGIVLVAMYVFGRFGYSRIIVFGTILLSSLFEIIFVSLYFIRKKSKYGLNDSITFSLKPHYIYPHISHEESDFSIPEKFKNIEFSIKSKLEHKYLVTRYDLNDFIKTYIPIDSIDYRNSMVINTHTFYNLETVDPGSQEFFMNLHRINDFRRLNRYFIQANKNLKYGGYFIGCVRSIHVRQKYLFSKYPFIIAFIIHNFDLVFNRIIPKLPLFKSFYFIITKGQNRALSKAESLGRLQYCGFKVIATKEIDDKLYFITRKVGGPSKDTDPSYGPLIKLKRVGKDSEIMFIYKFRTMHAYSEYLQTFVHEQNELELSGKFMEDFRITSWGKVLRKLWIDELPQFINWIRGDVSLVGVRALSFQYFSLYPEDMQLQRVQFKPGLVPPYYADMPKNFDEIVESERRYLLKRKKRPISTQFEYFFKAWWNILVKGARSK